MNRILPSGIRGILKLGQLKNCLLFVLVSLYCWMYSNGVGGKVVTIYVDMSQLWVDGWMRLCFRYVNIVADW